MLNIDLGGKVAVVTGGSGQIGRDICRTLGRCGADVAVHYHSKQDMAVHIRDELRTGGVRSTAVQADITCAASVGKMRESIERELGPVDIVVNNAVVIYEWKPVLEQPVDDYESQFRSCVLHNVLMAQAFVPGMIRSGGGRIIAVNTVCSMECQPGQSAYVAGKRGMDGVLRVLAREVGEHGICVNQVAPGWMASEDAPDVDNAAQRHYRNSLPLRRRGHARDVAHLVAFLASDLAGFITGQFISVSGGHVMPAI